MMNIKEVRAFQQLSPESCQQDNANEKPHAGSLSKAISDLWCAGDFVEFVLEKPNNDVAVMVLFVPTLSFQSFHIHYKKFLYADVESIYGF
ncbi:MAG: hypothetical protein C0179_00640 [Fervidicoccus sp.]|jgi:hypothetical protein|nr:MAG: hypothetical protein C0179_00640 [Fervidicoccus sp.]